MNRLKKLFAVLLVGVTAIVGTGCTQQTRTQEVANPTVKQATEEAVNLAENRIVALSVALVDVLGELNIEMVGVPNTQYTLHESAKDSVQVGLSMSPDIELVSSLFPTHVLALSTLESMTGPKLEQVGIVPTYLQMENVDALRSTVRTVGEMFDREEEAEQLVARFDGQIQEVLGGVTGKEAPKVLVLFGFPGNYLVATGTSFVGQMVELLGGVNVVSDASMAYANVNMEELIVQAPDVILRLTHGVKEEVVAMFEKEFTEDPIWQQFEAVRTSRVYDLDDSKFNVSATLQTPEALAELAGIIYP